MNEWQKIEDCPIKPFDPAQTWKTAAGPHLVYPGPQIARSGYTSKGKGRWQTAHGNVFPTHWMPLPPPPSSKT